MDALHNPLHGSVTTPVLPNTTAGAKGVDYGQMPDGFRRTKQGSAQPVEGRCGAKLTYSDPPRYCKSLPSKGSLSGRCKLHGGYAAKGIAAPNYHDGSHSRYIPNRLADDYYKALGDPEKLALKHEIAFWIAREQDLARRVDTGGDPVQAWHSIHEAVGELSSLYDTCLVALKLHDAMAVERQLRMMGMALRQCSKAIKDGMEEHHLYDKIQEIHDFTSKLKSLEHRRIQELQQSWTSDQVSARFGQFMHFLWEASLEMLPPHTIRPFLTRWQQKMKTLNAEWVERSSPFPGCTLEVPISPASAATDTRAAGTPDTAPRASTESLREDG